MLHLYTSITKIIINEEMIKTTYLYRNRMQENMPDNTCEYIDWNNFSEVYAEQPLKQILNLKNKRKGLVVDVFTNDFEVTRYEQWQDKLSIKVITEWKEVTPSINQILNFYDGDVAIKYLVERGMNCIPVG